MLLIFPLVAVNKGSDEDMSKAHIWLPILEAAIIFYINYLFLIEKLLLGKRQYLAFVAINIGLIALFRFDMYFVQLFSHQELRPDKMGHDGRHETQPLSLIRSLLALTLPALLAIGVKVTEEWKTFELEKSEIANQNLKSELRNLKYQLQPHFFFNSLNNIYSLVELSPGQAQQAIHNLSKMMRYLLYDTNHETVDLAIEINFLRTYTQLMEIRQSEDILVEYKFPELKPGEFSIAPLLLIPIIENAYKHGVSATGRSFVSFDISLNGNVLLFQSSNSNYPKSSADESGSGIGLENLKRRLHLIYPGKHSLLTEVRENVYWIVLSIQLERIE